jgi:hypothetical protein
LAEQPSAISASSSLHKPSDGSTKRLRSSPLPPATAKIELHVVSGEPDHAVDVARP